MSVTRTYSTQSTLEVALVDANTGDVLWYNFVQEVGYQLNLTNEQRLREALERLLRPFPDAVFKPANGATELE